MGEFTITISRRDLLKLAGVTAVGAVLSGQTSVEAADNLSGDEIKYAEKKSSCCIRLTFAFAAAVNAARNDAKTLLIERSIVLGGLGVLGCVYSFMQTHTPDSDTPYLAKLKNRLRDKGLGIIRKFSPKFHDEMCEESGVNILYHKVLVDTIKNGDKITASKAAKLLGTKRNICKRTQSLAKTVARQSVSGEK